MKLHECEANRDVSLLRLPLHVIITILNELEQQDARNFALTCSKIRRVFISSEFNKFMFQRWKSLANILGLESTGYDKDVFYHDLFWGVFKNTMADFQTLPIIMQLFKEFYHIIAIYAIKNSPHSHYNMWLNYPESETVSIKLNLISALVATGDTETFKKMLRSHPEFLSIMLDHASQALQVASHFSRSDMLSYMIEISEYFLQRSNLNASWKIGGEPYEISIFEKLCADNNIDAVSKILKYLHSRKIRLKSDKFMYIAYCKGNYDLLKIIFSYYTYNLVNPFGISLLFIMADDSKYSLIKSILADNNSAILEKDFLLQLLFLAHNDQHEQKFNLLLTSHPKAYLMPSAQVTFTPGIQKFLRVASCSNLVECLLCLKKPEYLQILLNTRDKISKSQFEEIICNSSNTENEILTHGMFEYDIIKLNFLLPSEYKHLSEMVKKDDFSMYRHFTKHYFQLELAMKAVAEIDDPEQVYYLSRKLMHEYQNNIQLNTKNFDLFKRYISHNELLSFLLRNQDIIYSDITVFIDRNIQDSLPAFCIAYGYYDALIEFIKRCPTLLTTIDSSGKSIYLALLLQNQIDVFVGLYDEKTCASLLNNKINGYSLAYLILKRNLTSLFESAFLNENLNLSYRDPSGKSYLQLLCESSPLPESLIIKFVSQQPFQISTIERKTLFKCLSEGSVDLKIALISLSPNKPNCRINADLNAVLSVKQSILSCVFPLNITKLLILIKQNNMNKTFFKVLKLICNLPIWSYDENLNYKRKVLTTVGQFDDEMVFFKWKILVIDKLLDFQKSSLVYSKRVSSLLMAIICAISVDEINEILTQQIEILNGKIINIQEELSSYNQHLTPIPNNVWKQRYFIFINSISVTSESNRHVFSTLSLSK